MTACCECVHTNHMTDGSMRDEPRLCRASTELVFNYWTGEFDERLKHCCEVNDGKCPNFCPIT